MAASAEQVKKLREQTGAGILDCRKALEESSEDMDKALEWLKKKSLSQAVKKSSRKASEGVVQSYIHGESRIGVLVEVNSETDFVARNKEFQDFVKALTMHITAMNPQYVDEESIPTETLKKEKAILKEQALEKNPKPQVAEKISEGLYRKWLESVCLLNQEFVRSNGDKKQTVKEAVTALIAKMGENIVIRRFVRYGLGE